MDFTWTDPSVSRLESSRVELMTFFSCFLSIRRHRVSKKISLEKIEDRMIR